MTTYKILRPDCVTTQDLLDVNDLLGQLSSSAHVMTQEELSITAHWSKVFVASTDGHRIKGMATLCILYKPSGIAGFVEDVVVHGSLRGQGVGERLMRMLVAYARDSELFGQIDLTSKPERKAANKLYKKLGFKLRETNTYRLIL